MSAPKHIFPDPLECRWLDDRNFELLSDYRCKVPDTHLTIIAPAGMVTDFASVPKMARWFASIAGPYLPAAIIHDWLYTEESRLHYPQYDRAMADGLFLVLMKVLGVPWYKRTTMYLAVRAGGWVSFRKR